MGDVNQGSLGDCYLLSGLASVAENDDRFNKLIVNEQINNAGLYAFNFYVRGIPKVIVVDDAVPYDNIYRYPAFARLGKDNSIWAPLMEKAYAKVNGNYDNIQGGVLADVALFALNSPVGWF